MAQHLVTPSRDPGTAIVPPEREHSPLSDPASTRPDPNCDATDAPAFPELVSRVYESAALGQRVTLLTCLLRPIGPLAAAAVATGAFVQCFARAQWQTASVTVEDALSATSGQVLELARYVEQSHPQIVVQVVNMLSRDATLTAIVGSSMVALLMKTLGRRR